MQQNKIVPYPARIYVYVTYTWLYASRAHSCKKYDQLHWTVTNCNQWNV